MKKDIIVIGGGGYSSELCGIIKREDKYNILGYTDIKKSKALNYLKYFGDESKIEELKDLTDLAILGIGQDSSSKLKKRLINIYKYNNFKFETVVSSNSIVDENSSLGEGVVVRENCFISSGVKIGNYTIISNGVNVIYDTTIGSLSNISLGVIVGHNVNIGNNVTVGIGSTIMSGISIGENCLIGSGSLVTKNCDSNSIYFGHPAKKYKSIDA